MSVRITQRTVSQTVQAGLQANMARMQRLQEQLSSGKAISRPSDAPVKTAAAMQFRSDVRRTEQYARNSDDGLAWLGTADAVLTKGMDLVRRARDLTLTGMNATTNAEGRAALAVEIDALRGSLLDVANTRYLDRPVFSGTAVTDVSFRPDGTYAGDQGQVARTVAPSVSVAVNVSGTAVFGADTDTDQAFAVLERLSASLRNTDPVARHAGLQADLTALDTATDRMVNALGKIGASYNRVETMRASAEDQLLTLRTGLSETEDVDLARTIVDLQMQEVAYKAALGATARVVQPSLIDFLR